jgi:hypothetical protein
LQQEGHTNIHLIAIAFKGKEVKMVYEEAEWIVSYEWWFMSLLLMFICIVS